MVHILRGLPGSGKTTFAKNYDPIKNFLLLEGDQSMYDERGNYNFKNAKSSREYVSKMLYQSLKLGNSNVVITTAGYKSASIQQFVDICRKFGVRYVVTHVFTNEDFGNEHFLSKDIIEGEMLKNWEPFAGERYLEITSKDGPVMRDRPPSKYRTPRI